MESPNNYCAQQLSTRSDNEVNCDRLSWPFNFLNNHSITSSRFETHCTTDDNHKWQDKWSNFVHGDALLTFDL